MRRIIAISLILVTISGLALAEVATEAKFKPQAYVLKIGSTQYIVITPLDKEHSVLVAQKGSKDQYMVEGIMARSLTQTVKLIAGKPSNDSSIRKLVDEMVAARAVYLGGDKAVAKLAKANR